MLAGSIETLVFIYHITRLHISGDIRFNALWPVPVVGLSSAWVCDRSLAGITGSNLTVDMAVSLMSVVCFQVESLKQADHLYRGEPPSVLCLSVIVKPLQ